MLLGLISDTHDNRERTKQALAALAKQDPAFVLHAGDLNTGASVPLYQGFHVLLAQGNVDRPLSIREAIRENDVEMHYEILHEIPINETRIGLIHGDDEARMEGMINGGAYDVIVHGHTHEFRDETIGSTRVINPGAVHRASTPSVCVFDTAAGKLERFELST